MANPSAAKLRRQARRSPPPSDSHSSDTDERASSSSSLSDQEAASSNDVAITPLPLFSIPRAQRPQSPTMSRVRLLITSLGNPPPYHSTRHSAGHILLRALASHLGFPPLTSRSREYGNGYLSTSDSHPQYTLLQSASVMNVSGPPVLKAWKTFTHSPPSGEDAPIHGLVVLHDELEASLGSLKVKRGTAGSARGHNGIKSVQASLQGVQLGERFVKVGIGIGRPVSRDRDDVSGFVLGQLTGAERGKVEGAAGNLVELLEREIGRMGKT